MPAKWIIRDGGPTYRAILKLWNVQPVSVKLGRLGSSKGHTCQAGTKAGEASIEVRGITVEMWHPKVRTISVTSFIPWVERRPDMGITQEHVQYIAKLAALAALKKCTHPGAVFVRMAAKCLHRYRCPACGETFEVDSSG